LQFGIAETDSGNFHTSARRGDIVIRRGGGGTSASDNNRLIITTATTANTKPSQAIGIVPGQFSAYGIWVYNNLNARIGNYSATPPTHRFEVDGTIRATEIRVEAQTADFVFEDDYELRPLEEVESFINDNGHLPDIPSAAEMEKDGVGLAEMNKLLLQKIEELTLYVIELKKEIKEIKEK